MKKFRFRLEPLLKVKDHIEKQRQKDLADANRKVLDHRSAIAAIDQGTAATMDDQRSRQVGLIRASEMLVYSRFLMRMKRDRMTESEVLRGLEIESEKRRQHLLEASRERKKYEKLKEKLSDRFNANATQLFQKESDEIAVMQYRRLHPGA